MGNWNRPANQTNHARLRLTNRTRRTNQTSQTNRTYSARTGSRGIGLRLRVRPRASLFCRLQQGSSVTLTRLLSPMFVSPPSSAFAGTNGYIASLSLFLSFHRTPAWLLCTRKLLAEIATTKPFFFFALNTKLFLI